MIHPLQLARARRCPLLAAPRSPRLALVAWVAVVGCCLSFLVQQQPHQFFDRYRSSSLVPLTGARQPMGLASPVPLLLFFSPLFRSSPFIGHSPRRSVPVQRSSRMSANDAALHRFGDGGDGYASQAAEQTSHTDPIGRVVRALRLTLGLATDMMSTCRQRGKCRQAADRSGSDQTHTRQQRPSRPSADQRAEMDTDAAGRSSVWPLSRTRPMAESAAHQRAAVCLCPRARTSLRTATHRIDPLAATAVARSPLAHSLV